ncbi:MAG TPA: AraC family transcriptional regulator, partial [Trichocoleus sp.]
FHHSFGKHFHEAYTIGLNEGGQGSFYYQGKTWCTSPQSLNLINPGAVHTGKAEVETGWVFRNLYLSVPAVELLLPQLDWLGRGLPYFRQPIVCDRTLGTAFSRLFQALSEPTPLLEQQSCLLTVLYQLFKHHAEPRYEGPSPRSETNAIALVRAYLEAHYTDPVSIETLAQMVSLSPYYLIRSFHRQVGVPPHQYQRHWQLLQAKRALRTSKSLTEVALAHGFYDQSHLNRHFKRAFGVTPGQYRQSNFVQDG